MGIDPQVLKHEDVQRVMKILEGLINGTHKLVIESEARVAQYTSLVSYTHTFKVEGPSE